MCRSCQPEVSHRILLIGGIQGQYDDICGMVNRLCHPQQLFEEYLRVGYFPINSLGRAELLHLLYSDSKTITRLQKPDKIYLHAPNMLYALGYGDKIGTIRECFFCKPGFRESFGGI